MLDKSFVTAWVVAFVRLFARVCSPVVLTLLRCAVADVLPASLPLATPLLCALDLDLCKAHRREGRRRRAAHGGADVHRGGKRQRHFFGSLRLPTQPTEYGDNHSADDTSARRRVARRRRGFPQSPCPLSARPNGERSFRGAAAPAAATAGASRSVATRRCRGSLLILDHHLPVQGEPAGKEAWVLQSRLGRGELGWSRRTSGRRAPARSVKLGRALGRENVSVDAMAQRGVRPHHRVPSRFQRHALAATPARICYKKGKPREPCASKWAGGRVGESPLPPGIASGPKLRTHGSASRAKAEGWGEGQRGTERSTHCPWPGVRE